MSTTNTTHNTSTTAWLGELAAELTGEQLDSLVWQRHEMSSPEATADDLRTTDECLIGDAKRTVERTESSRGLSSSRDLPHRPGTKAPTQLCRCSPRPGSRCGRSSGHSTPRRTGGRATCSARKCSPCTGSSAAPCRSWPRLPPTAPHQRRHERWRRRWLTLRRQQGRGYGDDHGRSQAFRAVPATPHAVPVPARHRGRSGGGARARRVREASSTPQHHPVGVPTVQVRP